MLDLLADPNAWASLLTLTVMEIVLGVDNIVFISVLVSRLPVEDAQRARRLGLALALIFRIVLLLMISWIIGLEATVFDLGLQGPVEMVPNEVTGVLEPHAAWDTAFSWRDIILIAGGLFLLVKAVLEIHKGIEGHEESGPGGNRRAFGAIIAQIIVIDMVFSVDSIITAVGMADHVEIMIAAVVIAVAIMYVASGPIAHFVHVHPTTKMLALAFLLLVGVALVADGVGFHIPRGYIYFSMAFAAGVEFVNILAKRRVEKTG